MSIPNPFESHTIDLSVIGGLTDEQLFRLCASNKEIKFERTIKGELILMSPTGGKTGSRNSEISYALVAWNRHTNLGRVFDSSTGFKLPNGAIRSPDAAWVALKRWQALTSEEQDAFVPLCPDFVVELLSKSDYIHYAKEKMNEWMQSGCKLAWLLDADGGTAYVFCRSMDVEIVSFDSTLNGGDVLPGFSFDLQQLRNI